MRKFTGPQIKFLIDLVEGALAGHEYFPGDGRCGEALLKAGLVESGHQTGYTSMYKLTALAREKFKIDETINRLGLNFLINDPVYSKYINLVNRSERLFAEASKLEDEQYDSNYDAYCVDGRIHDLVRGNSLSIKSIVEEALLGD